MSTILQLTPHQFQPNSGERLRRLNQSQFSAAEEIAKKISLPLETPIEELAVYQCSPFLELKKFGLSR